MQAPPRPSNESIRLQALRSLGLLDTPPEERFDRLTRIAKRLFGVPIALVSLVDGDRQWFKSKLGLDACETSREISFCGHAILTDRTLVVPDTRLDARFADNPLVTGPPHIRFYAGCPLSLPGALRIGTLCIIDQQPRTFSADDSVLLADLARIAEVELSAQQVSAADPLTQLSKRRAFEARSQRLLVECRARSSPATLLLFDLVDFGVINDTLGYLEGDRALQDFAALLGRSFRSPAVLGRLGPERFGVLVPDVQVGAEAPAVAQLQEGAIAWSRRRADTELMKFAVRAATLEPGTQATIADAIEACSAGASPPAP